MVGPLQLRRLLVVEGPELVGRPEREDGAVADAEPAALGERLVEDAPRPRLRRRDRPRRGSRRPGCPGSRPGRASPACWPSTRSSGRSTGAIVRPRNEPRAAASTSGRPASRSLLVDGVVRVARARDRRRAPASRLRRAEVDEQLGDVGEGEEPVVGGCGAATRRDHRHRDARGQACEEREHARWRASRGGSARPPAPRSAPPHPHLASCPTSSHSTGRAAPAGSGEQASPQGGWHHHGARCAGWDRIQPWIATPAGCSPPWTGGHPAPARPGAAICVGDRRR